jgi:hypothetical protein
MWRLILVNARRETKGAPGNPRTEIGETIVEAAYVRRLPHLDVIRIVVSAKEVRRLFLRSLEDATPRRWKSGFRRGKPIGLRKAQLEGEVLQSTLRAVAFNAFQQVQAHLETPALGLASPVTDLPEGDEALLNAAQPSAKPPPLKGNRAGDFAVYAVFLTHPKVVLPGSEEKPILPGRLNGWRTGRSSGTRGSWQRIAVRARKPPGRP